MRNQPEQKKIETYLERLRKFPRFRRGHCAGHDKIETYLDHLCSCLGVLSPEARAEIRQEIRQHLVTLAAAREARGIAPGEAVDAALRQFGDPIKLGRRMASARSKNIQFLISVVTNRYGLIEDALIIAGLYIAYAVFHADYGDILALLISLPMLRLFRILAAGALRLIQRRPIVSSQDALQGFKKCLKTANPLAGLNAGYVATGILACGLIWLLPNDAYFKRALFFWWSYCTTGPAVVMVIAWQINHRMQSIQ